MSQARTYLDHNATSPLRPEVLDVMTCAMQADGNPSSIHTEGRYVRGLLEDAREKVAHLVGAQSDEIIFTSGGSEANNLMLQQSWGSVIVLATEHESVMTPVRDVAGSDRPQYAILPVDRSGRADLKVLDSLMAALISRDGPMLISVQMANNETGVLQDMAAIGARITGFVGKNDPRNEDGSQKKIVFHSDGVQALAKIPVDFKALGLDAMSLSAHKIGGPKGIGALVKRKSLRLSPLIKGGGQEFGSRAGTENVAGIVGFGKACELAMADLAGESHIRKLRDRLEAEIKSIMPDARIIASETPRLPNTSAIIFPGVLAETQVIAFDLKGIAISAGAACSSGKVGRSRVLEAMRVHDNLANAAIRVSLGWNSVEQDIDNFLAAVPKIISNKPEATQAA